MCHRRWSSSSSPRSGSRNYPGSKGNHVHAESVDQIRSYFAHHTVGFIHFHRCTRRIQLSGLAKLVDRIHVHTGDATTAQIERHPIPFAVLQRRLHSLS